MVPLSPSSSTSSKTLAIESPPTADNNPPHHLLTSDEIRGPTPSSSSTSQEVFSHDSSIESSIEELEKALHELKLVDSGNESDSTSNREFHATNSQDDDMMSPPPAGDGESASGDAERQDSKGNVAGSLLSMRSEWEEVGLDIKAMPTVARNACAHYWSILGMNDRSKQLMYQTWSDTTGYTDMEGLARKLYEAAENPGAFENERSSPLHDPVRHQPSDQKTVDILELPSAVILDREGIEDQAWGLPILGGAIRRYLSSPQRGDAISTLSYSRNFIKKDDEELLTRLATRNPEICIRATVKAFEESADIRWMHKFFELSFLMPSRYHAMVIEELEEAGWCDCSGNFSEGRMPKSSDTDMYAKSYLLVWIQIMLSYLPDQTENLGSYLQIHADVPIIAALGSHHPKGCLILAQQHMIIRLIRSKKDVCYACKKHSSALAGPLIPCQACGGWAKFCSPACAKDVRFPHEYECVLAARTQGLPEPKLDAHNPQQAQDSGQVITESQQFQYKSCQCEKCDNRKMLTLSPWYADCDWNEIYEFLVNTYRLRIMDEYRIKRHRRFKEDSVTAPLNGFTEFLTVAASKALLPQGWDEAKQGECRVVADSPRFHHLLRLFTSILSEEEDEEHYGDDNKCTRMRALATSVEGLAVEDIDMAKIRKDQHIDACKRMAAVPREAPWTWEDELRLNQNEAQGLWCDVRPKPLSKLQRTMEACSNHAIMIEKAVKSCKLMAAMPRETTWTFEDEWKLQHNEKPSLWGSIRPKLLPTRMRYHGFTEGLKPEEEILAYVGDKEIDEIVEGCKRVAAIPRVRPWTWRDEWTLNFVSEELFDSMRPALLPTHPATKE